VIARAVVLAFGFFLATSTYGADDHNAIFEKAMETVDFEFEERWAFTETRVDSEHEWMGRYDPRRSPSERWQIISVDGRGPTEEEIEEFVKEKADDDGGDGNQRVNALVEKDSVRLIEESSEFWLFGFTPDDDQKVMKSVDATIRVAKDTGQLEYIDMRNHEPIKPGYGVKISKLITRLTFGPAGDGGPVVPLSAQVEVKGRAYLVVSFDEKELIHRSEFEFVGDDWKMVPDR